MGFQARNKDHLDAMKVFVAEMAKLGLDAKDFGVETDPESVRKQVVARSDDGAKMLQYRPDFECIINGQRYLFELKTKKGKQRNFAFHLHAYAYCSQWRHKSPLYYILVDMGDMSIKCCKAENMPRPKKIHCPPGNDDVEEFAKNVFPGIEITPCKPKNDSSDLPFFLISPRNRALRSFPPANWS